jgi:hypothetical protein
MPPKLTRRESHRPGLTTAHDGTWLAETDPRESQRALRERDVRQGHDRDDSLSPQRVPYKVRASSPPKQPQPSPQRSPDAAQEQRDDRVRARFLARRESHRPGLTTAHDGSWLTEADPREPPPGRAEAPPVDRPQRVQATVKSSPPKQPRPPQRSAGVVRTTQRDEEEPRRPIAKTQRATTEGARYPPPRSGSGRHDPDPPMQLLVEGHRMHVPPAVAQLSADELADQAVADAAAAAWGAGRTAASSGSPRRSKSLRRNSLASIGEGREDTHDRRATEQPTADAVHCVPHTVRAGVERASGGGGGGARVEADDSRARRCAAAPTPSRALTRRARTRVRGMAHATAGGDLHRHAAPSGEASSTPGAKQRGWHISQPRLPLLRQLRELIGPKSQQHSTLMHPSRG